MNILVLCTGNSARSILLESLLNHLSEGRVTAFSAGSQPAGRVHAEALRLLAEKGYATGGLRSKSWDEFGADDAPEMDAVITVCGRAAGETCPIWPGAPLRARAEALLSHPIESMERAELATLLTEIGTAP
ncbi:MAG: arsenate reductase ArsC [Rhodobacter sp.]|nr:arsenate reductase ArsC [Rhodobacter sp.]